MIIHKEDSIRATASEVRQNDYRTYSHIYDFPDGCYSIFEDILCPNEFPVLSDNFGGLLIVKTSEPMYLGKCTKKYIYMPLVKNQGYADSYLGESRWNNSEWETVWSPRFANLSDLDKKAETEHEHMKSEITDFPTAMPPTAHSHAASDITQDREHRMVSDAQTASWDGTYEQSTAYTDKAISDLVGGAPTTLDTLKEIADAMQANETVVEALDAAIGTKASQAELDGHTGNSTIHVTATEKAKWDKKAEEVHTHTKSQITDFPTAMTPVSHASTGTGYGVSSASNYGHSKAGASAPLMDGTAAAGTDNGQYARADHRHPVDTSRAAASHTHTKSQITDFPATMPASDVPSWAKQPNKPSYAYSEITGKPSTYPPTAHTHDDRYYTENEVDTKLSGKSDTGHKHTKSEITDFPTAMTPVSHASTGTGYGVSSASNYGHSKAGASAPLMDGTAAAGTDNGQYARADHRHPVDTSRAAASHTHDDRYKTKAESANVKIQSSAPTDTTALWVW